VLNRQCICKYNANSLCQGLGLCQGPVQDCSYLVSMMGKKGEMAPFLDSGCQKYGRPWDTCGSKLISPKKEMALSYWACGDWTCENKHLNLFNLHSKVEISDVKCSQVGLPLKLHTFVLNW